VKCYSAVLMAYMAASLALAAALAVETGAVVPRLVAVLVGYLVPARQCCPVIPPFLELYGKS
jgi:hypothetical protein